MICNNIHDFIHCISEGRILGLDIGLKNIGIALTDVSKLIANPYNVLSRKTFKQDLSILNNIIIEYKICGIVAGLPKQMNGIEGASCTMVKNFIEKLDQYLSVPIFLQDERLTTTAALRILKESGISRKKQEKLDDKIAASYILQTVLDQMRFINGT
ncbi:MAG: Holliday junction resolvase RuvX [Rickettsiales endosymbiont of Dermacentor nuttalli]